MSETKSENIFENYLINNKLHYEKNYYVGKGDIDFRVNSKSLFTLCDVKEVRKSINDKYGELDAYGHIREDVRALRKKFDKNVIKEPVILVTMNISNKIFTGFNILRAIYGDIGINFDREMHNVTRNEHFSKNGNACFTQIHNTIISGILILDVRGNHCLFKNCYACNEISDDYFPEIQEGKIFKIKRDLSADIPRDQILLLSTLVFEPVTS